MRRNKSKKKAIVVILLMLVMAISVGYAAISTTLTINGNATVRKRNWNIYFDNIVKTEGSITATIEPTINENKTEVTWGVSMKKPGEFYEFTVDAVNAGDIDAMIGNLSNTTLTEAQQKYLKYTVTYVDGGAISQYDELKAGETAGIKVRLEFKTEVNAEDLPTEAEEITLTYTSEYIQADENARGRNTYEIIFNANNGTGTMENQTMTYNTGAKLQANSYTRTGYTFLKWNTEQDGTGTSYENEEEVRNLATSGTVNLYAIWEINIGTTVNYITKLNEVELRKWKVFYKEGEYIYLILGDYLPNTAVSITGIAKEGEYGVVSSINRETFLNAIGEKSNYDSLLRGTINGKEVNETRTEQVWAMGTPTLDLWVKSWNASYSSDKLYISGDDSAGYKIGETANSTDYSVNLSSKEGYNNSLYFLHKNGTNDGCAGYWLDSPSANNSDNVMFVLCEGSVDNDYCKDSNLTLRPIVRLPYSVIE